MAAGNLSNQHHYSSGRHYHRRPKPHPMGENIQKHGIKILTWTVGALVFHIILSAAGL